MPISGATPGPAAALAELQCEAEAHFAQRLRAAFWVVLAASAGWATGCTASALRFPLATAAIGFGVVLYAAYELLRYRRLIEQRSLESREAERFARATVDGLAARIAILDRRGTIIGVNRTWREEAAGGARALAGLAEGTNYLASCDAAARDGLAEAKALAAGVRNVIAGQQQTYRLEYRIAPSGEELGPTSRCGAGSRRRTKPATRPSAAWQRIADVALSRTAGIGRASEWAECREPAHGLQRPLPAIARRGRRSLWALLMAVALAGCSDRKETSPAAVPPQGAVEGPATALQPSGAPPAPSGEAEGLFDEGVAAFQAGDQARAARLFERAANAGHAHAQVQLGWQYEYGKGVPRDLDAAVVWYYRAAEQGDPRAQHNIGNLYLKGKGLPLDPERALTWLARSAQQGDADAMHDLGYMYEFGVGVPKSREQAIAWYSRAGELGNRESAFAAEHLRRGGVAAPSAAARDAFLARMFRDILDTSAAYDRMAEERARGRARAAGDSEGNWRSYLSCSSGRC